MIWTLKSNARKMSHSRAPSREARLRSRRSKPLPLEVSSEDDRWICLPLSTFHLLPEESTSLLSQLHLNLFTDAP